MLFRSETFEQMKSAGFVYNPGILKDMICQEAAGILPLIRRKMADVVNTIPTA